MTKSKYTRNPSSPKNPNPKTNRRIWRKPPSKAYNCRDYQSVEFRLRHSRLPLYPSLQRPSMRERAYITFLAKSLLSREPDLLIYHLRPNQLEHFQRAFPAIKFSTDGLLALLPYPWRSGP